MVSVPALVPKLPVELKLDRDAVTIGDLYAKGRQSLFDSTRYFIECGGRLKVKKAGLAHGQWLPWLRVNEEELGFGISAANKLMAAYSNSELTTNLDEATALAVNRQIWGNGKPFRTLGTGNNEWHTPSPYVELARAVMGSIDLDPASNDEAQQTVRAAEYFTKDDDGLAKEWHGKIWLNPPYSQPLIDQLIAKLIAEYHAGRVTEAVLLTHNSTDTAWGQAALRAARVFCLTRGRISFVAPADRDFDDTKGGPAQGQCFFYFGGQPDVFAAHFAEIGFIAEAFHERPRPDRAA